MKAFLKEKAAEFVQMQWRLAQIAQTEGRSEARDGAAISGEEVLRFTAVEDAEIVLVDAA